MSGSRPIIAYGTNQAYYEDSCVQVPSAFISGHNLHTNEVYEITISGIPEGSPLHDLGWSTDPDDGFYDSVAGTWTGTVSGDFNMFGITPPENSDVDYPLTFEVERFNTQTCQVTGNTSFGVHNAIDAVADDVEYTQTGMLTDGNETTFSYKASFEDTDGSEVLREMTLDNIPDGVSVQGATQQPDGSWVIYFNDIQPDANGDVLFDIVFISDGSYTGPINATVTATNFDNPTDYGITMGNNTNDETFTITGEIVCYASGTMITKNDGSVIAVEEINDDDQLLTLDDTANHVGWKKHTSFSFEAIMASEKIRPIVFEKGALGENAQGESVPNADLMVSPQHCMVSSCGNNFMRAKHMVGANGIRLATDDEIQDGVTYHHA
jgi:hypothetical protein